MIKEYNMISTERADVLPGTSREIKFKVLELKTPVAHAGGQAMNDSHQIEYLTGFVAHASNVAKQTWSVFPGDIIGVYLVKVADENTAHAKTESIQPAFATVGGRIECPLCEKDYSDTERGHTYLQKHMLEKHNTIV